MKVAKSFEHENIQVLNQHVKKHAVYEKPLSAAEREELIQDLISTQRIEGIEVEYDEAAAVVDRVFAEPMPVMK